MNNTPVTGIRIPTDIVGKAKYVAWSEHSTLSKKTIDLLSADIAKWEKKNGIITEEQIKKVTSKRQ